MRKSQCEDSLKSARALIELQFHPLETKLMVIVSTYNLNTKSGDLQQQQQQQQSLFVPQKLCSVDINTMKKKKIQRKGAQPLRNS